MRLLCIAVGLFIMLPASVYVGQRHANAQSAADRPALEARDWRWSGWHDGKLTGFRQSTVNRYALSLKHSQPVLYPAAGVIDVTQAPYGAKGDGVADDTAALQQAINDYTGTRHLIYLPNGIYRISRPVILPYRNPQGNINYGNTHLQGQSRSGVILRLTDNTFRDPSRPMAMLDSGRHGSADWFANSVRDLTLDTGRANPGAIGLRFFSNNTGCVRDVTIRSGDGQGAVGLDLGYNDMNGPLLVKNMRVEGFNVGVQCGASVNSQTLVDLTLVGQTECGLRNEGQCLSLEHVISRNAVPAIVNRGGQMALVDAKLNGVGAACQVAAVITTADLYARNVAVAGYRTTITSGDRSGDREKQTQNAAVSKPVVEYVSSTPVTLFPTAPTALRLPVRSTPETEWDDPHTWASPFAAGVKPDEGSDISAGLQRAIDSGAATVYIPTGAWKISTTIIVRGNVRRIIGMNSYLISSDPVNSEDAPFFRVEDGKAQTVILEEMSFGFGNKRVYGIQNNTKRSLVLRDMEIYGYRNRPGAGPLFIEDVVGGPFTFTQETVWARQLNQESEGVHITNDGGDLWILGLKTERGGTLIETKGGGSTEVLGGLCYTTTAGKLGPMFVNRDSAVSVTLGERCYTGDPYTVILSETHHGQTRSLPNTAPAYRGRLVLYVGRPRARGTHLEAGENRATKAKNRANR